jgi:hypothetical protein
MAKTTCGKCGGTTFENVIVSPRGSNFKLSFVQCASCGAPIGVMDFLNIGSELQDLRKQLTEIQDALKKISGRS